jgi:hypothetical protein
MPNNNIANHYNDEQLREIAAEFAAQRSNREEVARHIEEAERAIRRWRLAEVEQGLEDGKRLNRAKERCRAIGQKFGPWKKRYSPYEKSMTALWMKAARLQIAPQLIVELGVDNAIRQKLGRESRGVSESVAAQHKDNAEWFAAFIALLPRKIQNEAIQRLDQGWEPREFVKAVRDLLPPPLRLRRPGAGIEQLMVDSGKFSEYNSDAYIDPDAYCTFIEKHRDLADVWVSSDHIDPDDPQRSAKISLENFKMMRARGLDPMPVFHFRDPFDYLRRYLDHFGCRYIGLGGGINGNEGDDFCAKSWEIIADYPQTQVHALGVGRANLLLAHPWKSADASTWMNGHRRMRGTFEQRAERVYRPALAFTDLEARIRRIRPEFSFYFVVASGAWEWPALRAVQHRSVLVSYNLLRWRAYLETMLSFKANPNSLLARKSYRARCERLSEEAERYHLHRRR